LGPGEHCNRGMASENNVVGGRRQGSTQKWHWETIELGERCWDQCRSGIGGQHNKGKASGVNTEGVITQFGKASGNNAVGVAKINAVENGVGVDAVGGWCAKN